MSLGIYEKISEGNYLAYSSDNDQTNPITTVHDGRNGDTFEIKLYIKSDDDHEYTNISIELASRTSDDDIGIGSTPGTSGWGAKVMNNLNHAPTEEDWESIDYGEVLNFGSSVTIESTNTVVPFWFRIESPRNIEVQNKTNIVLRLLYTDAG